MTRVSGADDDKGGRQIAASTSGFIDHLRKKISRTGSTVTDASAIVEIIVQFVTRSGLKSEYPQYEQGTFLDETLADFSTHFSGFVADTDWAQAIEAFEGTNSVPFMTVHKSKGLEYHTVVFLGLEDFPFRSFRSLQDEEAAAFFVAFSRAEMRVVFTFCRSRDGRAQSATGIKPLYQLLLSEGVKLEKIE